MASEPFFDKTRGSWYIKWKAADGWKKQRLGKHPGAWSAQKPPKRVPPEVERLAERYRVLEREAAHGLTREGARKHALGPAVDAYLDQRAPDLAPATLARTRNVFAGFVAWAQARKIGDVEGLTAEACRAWIASRLKEAAPGTVRTERATLAPLWARAVEDGWIGRSPWLTARVTAKARKEAPPFWSREEAARVVAACRGIVKDVARVGLNTGIRISALLALEWRDVDFARGVVVVRASESKSGRRYEVPLSGEANEVLSRRWADRSREPGQPLVFPSPRTGRAMTRSGIGEALVTALKRAGVPDRGSRNHIMRHTFASHAIMAGVPLYVVSQWLGHSSVKMTERYAHLAPSESQRQMAERFDALGLGAGAEG